MSNLKKHPFHFLCLLTCLVFLSNVLSFGAAQAVEVVTLHSGNAAPGNPDPLVRVAVGSSSTYYSPFPFTTVDFANACEGNSAVVVNPYPGWVSGLNCDPQAQWIGINSSLSPASALYCQSFDIQSCCFESASLTFCWAADDRLADASGYGPNVDGVYLNGVAVSPSINGGIFNSESTVGPIDVSGLVQCGTNELQVYNRDTSSTASGVIYSATLEILPCVVPNESQSFGTIKSQY
jgi:hypothetical protein